MKFRLKTAPLERVKERLSDLNGNLWIIVYRDLGFLFLFPRRERKKEERIKEYGQN